MTEKLTGFGVVLVTTASETAAENLAIALLNDRLAACVSIYPMRSIYRWQGQIENESEWQLVIKTDLKQFEQLSEKIQELHSYAVPEIIALPIVAGSQTYLDWLASHTGGVSE
ncbi:MAG: divalent-cation tolerance protein CutA [Microcystis sp. M04BS1]|uniref:Divalent-cation tolerance protein CutA n=1 Tax=Microcystis aeruginosa Ma_MB_S_20031200_S102 TaxID=2486254 RepID=A0A552EXH4_MICAE|nr:divalent-cation tolerance protein CutA [Microcystis aeruginosa]MCA2554532.1 divalent-cation tolerance protein CutA [Microcystis sp. M04BS1]MDB9508151.1 divalent-cation tolerance protein CutA [Microcystis aeruginosa CS-338/01]TRU29118.1 MAG: divalent-cation tolerance protein CutA [Microcystis aeruginosa Ma_MB_S_20031200_S102D]TRU39172.1 MAG: divalent-cation tolerance protein CutA [Microcystis aeruginosa Ma_MB_S_20031200_S102]